MGCEEERYYIGRVARLIFAKWRFVSLQIMTSTPFWFGDDGIGQALPGLGRMSPTHISFGVTTTQYCIS
jgi:hypothetical protein